MFRFGNRNLNFNAASVAPLFRVRGQKKKNGQSTKPSYSLLYNFFIIQHLDPLVKFLKKVFHFPFNFSGLSMNGFLRRGSRSPQKLVIRNVNAPDFETFEVTTDDISYIYNSAF